MNTLPILQHKKYIQTYVMSKPDGHKISPVSGGVLNGQRVSERKKNRKLGPERHLDLVTKTNFENNNNHNIIITRLMWSSFFSSLLLSL